MIPRSRWLSAAAEVAAWCLGIACALYVSLRYVDAVTSTRMLIDQFTAAKVSRQEREAGIGTTDVSLWSPARIEGWRAALAGPTTTPLAILRIPRVHLDVPVLEGTDDATLNRAVGHIMDTALPGTDGNAGIAGHRDGFFRGLKDIEVGDVLDLDTRHDTETYRVDRTWIVSPADVSVLDPTPTQSITLVTCYPFYFIGPAPQRFIVRAVRIDTPFSPRRVTLLARPPERTVHRPP
jgi:sortase A